VRKIESKLHSLMNPWITTKKTFYSLYVKFVNQNLIHIHKMRVKFVSQNLIHIHKMRVKFVSQNLTQGIKMAVNQTNTWRKLN